MANNSEVILRPVKAEDLEPIRNHLREAFFKDEPLNYFLELITEERPICADLEEYTLSDYNNGYGFVAERDGKIVAVSLNTMLERGKEVNVAPVTDEKFSKIATLLDYVEGQIDLFKRYPDVDKIINILVLSVDSSLRGQGIAKKLVNKTKEIGRANGAKLINVECTSFFSAAVSKSVGLDLIWSLDFADYKVNGNVVFKPAQPHKSVQVYTGKL